MGFNSLVKIRKQNLGKFIDSLRKKIEKIRNKLARYATGRFEINPNLNPKKEKLRIYAENIKNI